VTLKTIQLSFEAQNVIALRMMRLAAGGATAQAEARHMIADKMAAGMEVQAVAASSVTSGQKDRVVAGKILRVLKKTGPREQTAFVSQVTSATSNPYERATRLPWLSVSHCALSASCLKLRSSP
jgi:hypothetical protein